jgi:hypothetical protein
MKEKFVKMVIDTDQISEMGYFLPENRHQQQKPTLKNPKNPKKRQLEDSVLSFDF